MERNFEIGDRVVCKQSGVVGVAIRFYKPTACAEQTMVRTEDGRKYHAPTYEWVKIDEEISIQETSGQQKNDKRIRRVCSGICKESWNHNSGSI